MTHILNKSIYSTVGLIALYLYSASAQFSYGGGGLMSFSGLPPPPMVWGPQVANAPQPTTPPAEQLPSSMQQQNPFVISIPPLFASLIRNETSTYYVNQDPDPFLGAPNCQPFGMNQFMPVACSSQNSSLLPLLRPMLLPNPNPVLQQFVPSQGNASPTPPTMQFLPGAMMGIPMMAGMPFMFGKAMASQTYRRKPPKNIRRRHNKRSSDDFRRNSYRSQEYLGYKSEHRDLEYEEWLQPDINSRIDSEIRRTPLRYRQYDNNIKLLLDDSDDYLL